MEHRGGHSRSQSREVRLRRDRLSDEEASSATHGGQATDREPDVNARSLALSIEVPLEPSEAFERFAEELSGRLSLGSAGVAMRLEPAVGGRLFEVSDKGGDPVEVAEVRVWNPGERVVLGWHAAGWARSASTVLEIRFEAVEGATKVTLEHRGWGAPITEMFGDDPEGGAAGELLGWFAQQGAGPFIFATAPSGVGAWLTDRLARRPTGALSRETYRNPEHHRASFRATLEALALTPDDHLLEIGCGGGAFLHDALKTGCRAAAVDHSEEMVRLARRQNATAVDEGRLRVLLADAESLPFEDATFTAVAMTQVFFFFRDPLAVLKECQRVLAAGGRLAAFTASAEMAGTPAAPEPVARHASFYSDDELVELAQLAGFGEATVSRFGSHFGDAQLLYAKRSGRSSA